MNTSNGSAALPMRPAVRSLSAKKLPEYLEYVVVHEINHLLERNYTDRFNTLMTGFIPKWRFYKAELNRLSISPMDWNFES